MRATAMDAETARPEDTLLDDNKKHIPTPALRESTGKSALDERLETPHTTTPWHREATTDKKRPQIVPPSTLYPSSLPLDDRNELERHATDLDHPSYDEQGEQAHVSKDKTYAIRAIREGLGWLPAEVLTRYSNEELKELILSAIESTKGGGRLDIQHATNVQSDQANSSSSMSHEMHVSGQGFPRADSGRHHPSAQEWYESMTGGAMPAGWTAEYDYAQKAWYFIDYNLNPPKSSWRDPRTSTDQDLPSAGELTQSAYSLGPVPAVPFPPEEYARWYADTFARFQAYRQAEQGRKGPVEEEMRSERKRIGRLQRAQALIEEASRRLRDAAAGPTNKDNVRERTAAEVDLARAQGMMDRVKAEDAARMAMLPPWLSRYQGAVHGYDASQGVGRTQYVDAPFSRAPESSAHWQNAATSYNPPASTARSTDLAAAQSPFGLPQAPLPRFGQASTVPTPYGIPEACFAWDMLLRSTAPTLKLAAKPARKEKKVATNK